jgi:bacterioferritin
MKGNEKILTTLNELLAEELTAISQYMVHSEMYANWGYGKLHKSIEKQAVDEMKHAEWLIQRILFLEGSPVVSKLHQMKIGSDLQTMLVNDSKGEHSAVQLYNKAIMQAREIVDNGTADLLTKILLMEEGPTIGDKVFKISELRLVHSRVIDLGQGASPGLVGSTPAWHQYNGWRARFKRAAGEGGRHAPSGAGVVLDPRPRRRVEVHLRRRLPADRAGRPGPRLRGGVLGGTGPVIVRLWGTRGSLPTPGASHA